MECKQNTNLNNKITSGQYAALRILELYADTPYIDFHFGNSEGDYTSRIIEGESGVLGINGVYMWENNVRASLAVFENIKLGYGQAGIDFYETDGSDPIASIKYNGSNLVIESEKDIKIGGYFIKQCTTIGTFEDGVCWLVPYDLGLYGKPDAVILTPQSENGIIRYDFDNSTSGGIRITFHAMQSDGTLVAFNGNLRFGMVTYTTN